MVTFFMISQFLSFTAFGFFNTIQFIWAVKRAKKPDRQEQLYLWNWCRARLHVFGPAVLVGAE